MPQDLLCARLMRADLLMKNGMVYVLMFNFECDRRDDRIDTIIEQACRAFHIWLPDELLYVLYEIYDKMHFQQNDIVEFHFDDYKDDYAIAYEGDDIKEPVMLTVVDLKIA